MIDPAIKKDETTVLTFKLAVRRMIMRDAETEIERITAQLMIDELLAELDRRNKAEIADRAAKGSAS